MPVLNVEALLAAVSPESPAGADLAYDPAYLELFNKAKGTPETQVGDVVTPAQDPNWGEVCDGCTSILKRSKDLRVAVLAIPAALKVDGITGAAASLGLLSGLLQQYWDTLYPRLDPTDNNDPLERMNIVGSLAAPPEMSGDPLRIQRRLKEAPLGGTRQLGRFGLRDIALASGEGPPPAPGEARADMKVIDASFEATPIEELQGSEAAAAQALAHATAIDAFLKQKVGPAAPDLMSFLKCLKEVRACLQNHLARRGVGQGAGEAGSDGGGASGPSISGEVRTTNDVLLALDRICQYYDRNEPSSPIPMLLKRARRLVSKSFVDIINDLSPSAMDQIKIISGSEPPAT